MQGLRLFAAQRRSSRVSRQSQTGMLVAMPFCERGWVQGMQGTSPNKERVLFLDTTSPMSSPNLVRRRHKLRVSDNEEVEVETVEDRFKSAIRTVQVIKQEYSQPGVCFAMFNRVEQLHNHLYSHGRSY